MGDDVVRRRCRFLLLLIIHPIGLFVQPFFAPDVYPAGVYPVIPASVTEIGEDVFANCTEALVIFGAEGSEDQACARNAASSSCRN